MNLFCRIYDEAFGIFGGCSVSGSLYIMDDGKVMGRSILSYETMKYS